MSKLVIGLATRGRPEHLITSLNETLPRIRNRDTELIAMLDADDASSISAVREWQNGDHPNMENLIVNIADREETVGEKWNRMCKWNADVYVAHADHTHHATEGFDVKILEAASTFPDGIGVVFSYLANASFPSINAATKKWIDVVGYYYPPYFPYWFVDHWFDDIARITDRITFADVHCDSSRKNQMTQEMRETAWWATWFDATVLERRKIAFRIIDVLDEPEWRKDILKSRFPLVEARSKWVNDNVRAQSAQYDLASRLPLNDDRYQRIRKRALLALPSLMEGMPVEIANDYRARLSPFHIPPMKQHFAKAVP
jgi:hypothetical protein